jgi:UrcA family protein
MNTKLKSFSTSFDTAAAAAILFGILATGSAILGESLQARQTIKFQDSNLTTPAGVATLYSDIQSAAQRVCTAGQMHLTRSDQVNTCAQGAEARAVKKANVEALTAYAQMESKAPVATLAANSAK